MSFGLNVYSLDDENFNYYIDFLTKRVWYGNYLKCYYQYVFVKKD